MSVNHEDRANGWEAVAPASLKNSTVGVETMQAWARTLPQGASVLDLGCGPGSPRSRVLIDEGFNVYAVDAAPSMAHEYQRSFPNACVAYEAAEESSFFDRKFDAVVAWGLLFLLPEQTQRTTIHRVAQALKQGGRFLFTAPTQKCTWADNSTRRLSLSLGIDAYTSILAEAKLNLIAEYTDEGENHYYDAVKL